MTKYIARLGCGIFTRLRVRLQIDSSHGFICILMSSAPHPHLHHAVYVRKELPRMKIVQSPLPQDTSLKE